MRYDAGSPDALALGGPLAFAGYGLPQYPVWDGAQPSGAEAPVENTTLPPDEQLLSECAQVRLQAPTLKPHHLCPIPLSCPHP
jgi:hypothetical protein